MPETTKNREKKSFLFLPFLSFADPCKVLTANMIPSEKLPVQQLLSACTTDGYNCLIKVSCHFAPWHWSRSSIWVYWMLPKNILSWGQTGQSIDAQFAWHLVTLKAAAYNSHHFTLMKSFSDPSHPMDGDIIALCHVADMFRQRLKVVTQVSYRLYWTAVTIHFKGTSGPKPSPPDALHSMTDNNFFFSFTLYYNFNVFKENFKSLKSLML